MRYLEVLEDWQRSERQQTELPVEMGVTPAHKNFLPIINSFI
jgi:hypothetical protein